MTTVASTEAEGRKVDTIKLTISGHNVYGRMTPANVKEVLGNVGGGK
jgi:hypothetical protein